MRVCRRWLRTTSSLAVAMTVAACTLFSDLSGLSGGPGAGEGGPIDRDARTGGDGQIASDGAAPDAADAAPCTNGRNGTSCNTSSQCCSDSCYLRVCEGNEVGSRCAVNSNCTTNSCYANLCQSREIGSKCAADSKCESDNCYKSTCEGTGPGAGCGANSKCTSNICFDNVCQ